MTAVAASEVIEMTGDGAGVKRKSPVEPDSDEPETTKKLKTENGAAPPANEEPKSIDLYVYSL